MLLSAIRTGTATPSKGNNPPLARDAMEAVEAWASSNPLKIAVTVTPVWPNASSIADERTVIAAIASTIVNANLRLKAPPCLMGSSARALGRGNISTPA
ncbi:hypothetical protein D3C80_2003850 [compost metagenome]